MKKILFYSPFGGRTGSDMMLSYIISHLDAGRFQAIVFSERKWELVEGLPQTPAVFSSSWQSSRWFRFADLLLKRLFNFSLQEYEIRSIISRYRPDMVYLNTIVCAKMISVLRRVDVPMVTHCHELDYSYQSVSAADLEFMIRKSTLWIGCSEKVCRQLKSLGVRRVEKIYEGIDPLRFQPGQLTDAAIRRQFGIPETAHVWMMGGLKHYRKGFDFIPALAKHIADNDGWIAWIGKSFGTGYEVLVKKEIEALGLRNVILLEENAQHYFEMLQIAEGLALTSREDPFPLVMLEAAWLGKPVVAFNSGGAGEFINKETGSLIENFDVAKMGAAIIEYITGRRKADAAAIHRQAQAYEINRLMPVWQQVMERAFSESSKPAT